MASSGTTLILSSITQRSAPSGLRSISGAAPAPVFPGLGCVRSRPYRWPWIILLWKGNAWGYHLTNLLLHLVCVLGVVGLARVLFKEKVLALAAGLLFAVHSGHGEAVVAFLGRSDLLATAFLLSASVTYLMSGKNSGWRKLLFYWTSVGSFLLACFSKETALAFPGILLLLEGIRIKETPSTWRGILFRILPFFLVVGLYGAYRYRLLAGLPAPKMWWSDSPIRLGSSLFGAFGEYLRLFLFPLRLSPWYEVPRQEAVPDGNAVIGISGLVLCLAAFAFVGKRNFRNSLPLGWFLFGLTPVLAGWLLPVLGLKGLGGLPGPVVAERWLYLPSVGGCLAVAWVFTWLWSRAKRAGKTATAVAGVSLIFLLGWRQASWTPVWKDQESLARTIVATAPRSAFGYSNLGFALWERGRYPEAEETLRTAIAVDPFYPRAHYNLGIALDIEGRFAEAEAEYREAVWLNSDYADAHSNLGKALSDQGRYAEAEGEFRQAIRLNPNLSLAYYNLGVLLWNQGRFREAEAAYREALRMNPDDALAHDHLGAVLGEQGQRREAEAEYRQAIRLNPDFAEVHNNLGNVLGEEGRHAQAELEFRESIRLNPNQPGALWNLATSLDLQGRRKEARSYWERALALVKDPQARDAIQKRLRQPD